MTVVKSKNPRTPDIGSIEEFEDVANDILGEYVGSFTEESGLVIRDPKKIKRMLSDYGVPDDIEFGYILTEKGEELLNRQIYRLKCLALRRFRGYAYFSVPGMIEF